MNNNNSNKHFLSASGIVYDRSLLTNQLQNTNRCITEQHRVLHDESFMHEFRSWVRFYFYFIICRPRYLNCILCFFFSEIGTVGARPTYDFFDLIFRHNLTVKC